MLRLRLQIQYKVHVAKMHSDHNLRWRMSPIWGQGNRRHVFIMWRNCNKFGGIVSLSIKNTFMKLKNAKLPKFKLVTVLDFLLIEKIMLFRDYSTDFHQNK